MKRYDLALLLCLASGFAIGFAGAALHLSEFTQGAMTGSVCTAVVLTTYFDD